MSKIISRTIWMGSVLLGIASTTLSVGAEVTKGEASIAKRSAKLYLQQRQYDKALDQYLVAAEGRPDDLESHYNIGDIYGRKERYDDMNVHFNIIEQDPKGKKWIKIVEAKRTELWRQHYNLGVQGLNAQKLDFAIEQFLTAIKVNPKESDAYEGIGIAYLQSGKAEEGVQAYRNAIQRNPKKSQSYFNLSVALTNQATVASLKEALDLLQKGHELAPKDLQILQQMALLYNRSGDNASAGIAAEKALAVDPKNPTVLNIAAQIFLTAQDYQRSADILEKVLQITPDDQNAIFNLAIAYNNLKLTDKAVALYTKSVQANPDDLDALYQLSRLYLEIENFDGAAEYAQRVIDLKPDKFRAWGVLYQSLAKKSENASGAEAEKLVEKATAAYEMFEELKKQQAGQ
jgi:protein O-GlcNAc transferase